jgi:hypothetical protein
LEELYQCDRKLWLLFVGLPNLQLLSPPAKTWARGPAWASLTNLEAAPFNRALSLRLSGIAIPPTITPPASRRSISASGENPTRLTRFKNSPAQAELGRGTLEFCERRVGRGHRPKCSADARPRLLTFLSNDLGSSVISQGTPRDTRWLVRYACDSLRPVSVLIVLIGVLHDIVRRYSSAFGLLLCRDRLPLAVKGNGHANPKP